MKDVVALSYRWQFESSAHHAGGRRSDPFDRSAGNLAGFSKYIDEVFPALTVAGINRFQMSPHRDSSRSFLPSCGSSFRANECHGKSEFRALIFNSPIVPSGIAELEVVGIGRSTDVAINSPGFDRDSHERPLPTCPPL